MKKFNVFLSSLFCLFLGGMLVVSTILPDQDFSPLENRYLAKPPKLTLQTLKDGSFMSGAEEYVSDHIVGRDFWVALKAWSERLSGKQENNGVYFGKEDTLLNRVDTPSWTDKQTQSGLVQGLNTRLGFVDALVRRELSEDKNYDAVLACGPRPMLRNVARAAQEFGVPCQVSMEERMGCGVGACLVCACDMADGSRKHVCKDGPVFDSREVNWDV